MSHWYKSSFNHGNLWSPVGKPANGVGIHPVYGRIRAPILVYFWTALTINGTAGGKLKDTFVMFTPSNYSLAANLL